MQASPPATRQETVRFAFNSSLPIFFGYVILGTGYGLYMHNLGFGFWFPTIMAAVVYGGSVEFILASMLVQSFLPGNVVLITLVVGFRQFFYGLSMLKKYRGAGWRKFFLIYGLTDETFVVNYSLSIPKEYDRYSVYTLISLFDHSYWVLGAFLGGALGSLIGKEIPGMDFVMTALFIALAVDQFQKEKDHFSSTSGVIVTIACLLLFGKTYFLVATLLILVAEYAVIYWRQAKRGDQNDAD